MRIVWGLVAVLAAWAGIAALRRRAEHRSREEYPAPRRHDTDRQAAARRPARGDGDAEIDREELERAEREVKNLDAFQQPNQEFTGDDWGPGAPRGFPPVA